MHGEKRNASVRNPDGKRENGWVDMNWIHLVQNRGQWRALVNTVMNLRVP
jgi:hypothetical protein